MNVHRRDSRGAAEESADGTSEHDAVTMQDYARFLPARYQARATAAAPSSQWWTWRTHRIHLLRRSDPAASVRLILVHGAGAHAQALWPIASLLTGTGVDLLAVDLPLYGRTRVSDRSRVTYQDWIELLEDLIKVEDDGRPLILLGASIGGLLAVEASARSGRVAATVATCLLDPRRRAGRAVMTRFGALATPFMRLLPLVRGPVARIPLKISWLANLAAMGQDPGLGRLCAADARGGGAIVPLGFLASYLSHPHTAARTRPVPVHLMHPELDEWTPSALSEATLRQLPGPTSSSLLRGCGHFPLEEPGLQDLIDGIIEAVRRLGADGHSTRGIPA